MISKELKAKWIAALRSGEYKKRRHALCRDGKFCCLGVLCEVAGIKKEEGDTTTSYWLPYNIANETGSIVEMWCSEQVPAEIAGLPSEWCTKLADINDNPDSTFEEIADIIENNVVAA